MGATRHHNGKYSVQCDARSSLPNVSFTLDGHNFSIGPDDYIFEYQGGCISDFFWKRLPSTSGCDRKGFLAKVVQCFQFREENYQLCGGSAVKNILGMLCSVLKGA
jgi:hypothetical protein